MFHPKGPSFVELAVQALSSTERGYDLLAPRFDYTPFRTPNSLLHLVAERLKRLGPFDCGLDLCCGTGAGMQMLRPLCLKKVVGLDFSQGMLEVGAERIAGTPGAATLEFVRGNVLAMPFGPEFDVVVCFGAFGHILPKNEDRLVSEVARVLKPGGLFAFVTAPWPPFWSQRYWFARLFNGAMRLRNLLHSPPFIMYYLTFLLPEVRALLATHGFQTETQELASTGPFMDYRLVLARRSVE